MFARLYVEALLANEILADAVWEVWNAGLIPDAVAAILWLDVCFSKSGHTSVQN